VAQQGESGCGLVWAGGGGARGWMARVGCLGGE